MIPQNLEAKKKIYYSVTTVWDCCYLFDQLAQKPKYFNGFEEYVAEKSELFQDTPDLVEDFDSPICLACIMAKNFNVYYC